MVQKITRFYKDNQFLRVLTLFIMILLPWIVAVFIIQAREEKEIEYETKVELCKDKQPSVYHTKFEELSQTFSSAKEVTAACIKCHTERHQEIMRTSHWNWEKEDLKDGYASKYIGKRTALNNFCIGIQSNEQTCTRCHIGYGWGDKTFDFNEANAIDCLICHDNTGTYKKAKGKAGWPATGEKAPDYNYIAQNVCLPRKENCGVCHFWGGGGNNVKHGDLEKALLSCSRDVDIHMAKEGVDMLCIDCHKTKNHNITGRNYSNTYSNTNRVTCEQCHQDKPHHNKLLDNHTIKVSCQACHIPIYAKVNSTKMYWDWSTAGKLDENGEPFHVNDAFGNHTYLSIKGNFVWEREVVPEYVWFNGTADHYLLGDQVDTFPIQMNSMKGKYNCANSKIVPVKVHRGKTPYDPGTNMLLQLKTYGTEKGQGAFWQDFEWIPAAERGMAYVGLPFSGEVDFAETEMYMPINHMVSPLEQTVACIECHSRDGRLNDLNDFYMPGRDRLPWLDKLGFLILILSIVSVFIHGVIRVIMSGR
jgi:octaheme c-type cytochrome (tetrathionate reductase family)